MLNILILIISTSLILACWIWFCNAFSHQSPKKLMIVSGISGILSGGILLLYPMIMEKLFSQNFLDLNNFQLGESLGIFVLVCMILAGFFSKSKIFWISILFVFFSFFLINIFGNILGTFFSLLLFAFCEEVLKYSIGFDMRKNNFLLKSDFIIFMIIVGFGFAWIENIRYGISGTSIIFVIMIRGIVGFLAHSSFSSIVGFFGKNENYKIFFGIILAFLVHSSYNFFSGINLIFSLIFAICGYFWLTRVLEKSNSLYLK